MSKSMKWVISIDGKYIKHPTMNCPLYHEHKKSAEEYLRRVNLTNVIPPLSTPIIPTLQKVSVEWILDIINGKEQVTYL